MSSRVYARPAHQIGVERERQNPGGQKHRYVPTLHGQTVLKMLVKGLAYAVQRCTLMLMRCTSAAVESACTTPHCGLLCPCVHFVMPVHSAIPRLGPPAHCSQVPAARLALPWQCHPSHVLRLGVATFRGSKSVSKTRPWIPALCFDSMRVHEFRVCTCTVTWLLCLQATNVSATAVQPVCSPALHLQHRRSMANACAKCMHNRASVVSKSYC